MIRKAIVRLICGTVRTFALGKQPPVKLTYYYHIKCHSERYSNPSLERKLHRHSSEIILYADESAAGEENKTSLDRGRRELFSY